jgi:hypothetical protein
MNFYLSQPNFKISEFLRFNPTVRTVYGVPENDLYINIPMILFWLFEVKFETY